ncbi:MAG: HD domain-containing protein, partial [Myxococcota bacterium]
YYFHAHALRHHTKLIVERATKHRSRRAPTLRPARNGFRLWNGMLTVASRDHFTKDPASLIRIFRIAREESIEVYSYSKNLVALSRAAIDREARRSPAVVDEFLRLLESTSDDGRMLIALHQLGILAQIMPEWRRVIARWQHSMYHVYTVDAHSLEVLRNLKRLRIGTLMEQQPALTRLMVDVPRPTVVYMAALLHDIGKGWPSGDHSERGARVAKVVGERFEQAQLPRWTKQETDDLIWLVRHHLTMSDIAQRRDVSDSDLVAKFADEVDTIERLTMLYLLTFADMKGTSPKVWTDWKASLLRELYENTWTVMAAVKSGTIPSMEERRRRASAELLAAAAQTDRRVDAALVDAFTAAMPGRYLSSFTDRQMIRHVQMWRDVSRRGGLAVHIRQLRREDTTRLTIVGKDYPGLLAEVSGVLAGYGIDILSASIFSLAVYQRATEIMGPTGDLPYQHLGRRDHPRPNRIALDVLYVKDDSGRIADDSKKWNRIRSALEATVLERRGVESALRARRASGLDVPHRPRVNARVDVSNRDSRTETVIDIFGQNHIGALHTIAQKLTKLGLTISLAKISTQGDRLADGFYVTDTATGDQLKDSHRIRDLKRALIDALQMAAD